MLVGRIRELLGTARRACNRVLRPLNIKIDTLTAERAEMGRLCRLRQRGHFDRPAFPLLPAFSACDPSDIAAALIRLRPDIEQLEDASTNATGYNVRNDYCTSPDMEVFYCLVRLHTPRLIIEIGSGFSTQVARQAAIDANVATRIVSVDPQPRTSINALCDEVIRAPLEQAGVAGRISELSAGDMLYVDSSHEVRCGSDVTYLIFDLLPNLRSGVLVHFHDIFLPYEYPWEWLGHGSIRWNEQYLVQTMLQYGNAFDVLWPGHYLQRTVPDFSLRFPTLLAGRAQSLWLRRT